MSVDVQYVSHGAVFITARLCVLWQANC